MLVDGAGFAQVHGSTASWKFIGTNYDDPTSTANIRKGVNGYLSTHDNQSTAMANSDNLTYNVAGPRVTARAVTTVYMGAKSVGKGIRAAGKWVGNLFK